LQHRQAERQVGGQPVIGQAVALLPLLLCRAALVLLLLAALLGAALADGLAADGAGGALVQPRLDA
jgi:hypothetical protein